MFSHAKLNYYLVKRQRAAWIMVTYRGATAPEKKSNEKQAKYDDQGVNEPGGLDSFFFVSVNDFRVRSYGCEACQ